MVRVVPAFTQPKDAKKGVVATFVVAFERLLPPNVADGIDAPGDMMHEQD
ncbi:hypothetical protein [Anatilimnocola aggregata]|nr:hypothetical protein [Anatilimnocola aggregata]